MTKAVILMVIVAAFSVVMGQLTSYDEMTWYTATMSGVVLIEVLRK